jgi:hypothetical protein
VYPQFRRRCDAKNHSRRIRVSPTFERPFINQWLLSCAAYPQLAQVCAPGTHTDPHFGQYCGCCGGGGAEGGV